MLVRVYVNLYCLGEELLGSYLSKLKMSHSNKGEMTYCLKQLYKLEKAYSGSQLDMGQRWKVIYRRRRTSKVSVTAASDPCPERVPRPWGCSKGDKWNSTSRAEETVQILRGTKRWVFARKGAREMSWTERTPEFQRVPRQYSVEY